MAQRKSSPSNRSGSGKSSSRPAGKPSGTRSTSGKASGAKGSAARSAPAVSTTKRSSGPATRPPARKKNKSIVNQKQTPWGLIATTVAVVLFAAAVVIVVVATHKSDEGKSVTSKGGQTVKASDPYRQPELAAAAKIKGVTYRVEGQHNHTEGHIKYDATPPIGGLHNGFWADCTGTVYKSAIANENAVHMLEHGAIWITYNANDIKGAQLAKLKKFVAGVDRMALSPYPNLTTPISLQAWGYQLKVDKASDPRIKQFIDTLKNNKKTTPEYGASCSNPGFKSDPSSFGHPKNS